MRSYADAGKRYRALTPGAGHPYGLFLLLSFLFHLSLLFFIQHWDLFRPARTDLSKPLDPLVQLVDPETLFPPVKKPKEVLFGTDRPEDLKSIPRGKETVLPPIPKSLAPNPVPGVPQEKRSPSSSAPKPLPPTAQSRPVTPASPPSDSQMTAPASPSDSLPLNSLPAPAPPAAQEEGSNPFPRTGGLPGLPFADAKNLNRLAKVFSDQERRPTDPISLNTEDLKYFSYLLKVKTKIEYIWKYPEAAANRGLGGDVLLNFTIQRDGRVSDVSIASSSGYDLLDRGVAEAIQTASPFPPLPETWNEDHITITGHFLYVNQYTYIR